ncbi:MAG: dihydroneopterin aldolase [Chitinophagaceae bacterium]|nr:dihydroneopterin aldolase [Chitinophagaceae bacterium]
MLTIHLRDLVFQAFHGIYEEEKVLGNKYLVNCSVEIPEPEKTIREISGTINYEVLFKIIRDRMAIATPLLETVVMNTGELIHRRFPDVKSISIQIIKLHPPIKGFTGNFSVEWRKEYQPE